MSFLNSIFSAKEKVPAEDASKILREILETTREGVLVVGRDTRIIASNRAAYNAFARFNGALENKRLSEVIRDLNLHEAFQKALENDQIFDIKLEIPGNIQRRYDVHIAPIQLGGAKNAIGFFYDITQIERLERVRQEFLSNVSHELRTPLTAIMAFVETLEDGAIDDPENNQRFLGIIRKNAERMRHLINDILELSAIESGNVKIQLKKIKLSPLVDEIYTNVSAKAAERGVSLINNVPKSATVYADAVRLEQMLTNLIDNAVKFNRPAGTVTVSCERLSEKDEENVEKNIISVADAGEGISGEHLQRIFERFYRTDRARSRDLGGTGLGLAIVKHLARLHGGEVSVKSAPGEGSTFIIELPADQ
ncbi:MAG TPA: ATP-binding protein [Pyrinomonadaceae bacterium]|jgi:two-component system phosphate regulon sensor histidine kinase PhoR